MQRLEVKLGKRAYPILIGPGLLRSQELLAAHAEAGPAPRRDRRRGRARSG
jgi:hypothetical protein